MKPQLLNATQYAGLLKIGDVLIPGDGELPSFSESRCAEQADRMLAYMYDGDRNGVKFCSRSSATCRASRCAACSGSPTATSRCPGRSPPPRA